MRSPETYVHKPFRQCFVLLAIWLLNPCPSEQFGDELPAVPNRKMVFCFSRDTRHLQVRSILSYIVDFLEVVAEVRDALLRLSFCQQLVGKSAPYVGQRTKLSISHEQ